MIKANELRQKAKLFRRLRQCVTDRRALRAIGEVSGELEMTAKQAERWERIRERARIWVAQGAPRDAMLKIGLRPSARRPVTVTGRKAARCEIRGPSRQPVRLTYSSAKS
jgi:hypothetical protein